MTASFRNALASRFPRVMGALLIASFAVGIGASEVALANDGSVVGSTRACLLDELAHVATASKRTEGGLVVAGPLDETALRSPNPIGDWLDRRVTESTAALGPRGAVQVVRADACCFSVRTSFLRPPSWLGSPAVDPYVTRYRAGVPVTPLPAGFEMRVPRWLGVDRKIPFSQFYMPKLNLSDGEQLSSVLSVSAREADLRTTMAGEGGFSSAYFVHPEITPQLKGDWSLEALAAGNPRLEEKLREKWAAQNATEVIKVRRPGRHSSEEMARAILRDVAVEDVAISLASEATLGGEHFVRVARWRSSRDEIMRGIIRQEVVRGPRVAELEAAAHVVQSYKAGNYAGGLQRLVEASTLLADAGLTAEEATQKIAALEEFYRRSHQPILEYAARNRLTGLMNRNGSGAAEMVGLDYNHGQNVAWSPEERRFVIFDW